jgi:hypothetical protein
MRPRRTITELLCGPAIAITGQPDRPTTHRAAAPASPPARGPGRAPRRDVRGLGWFLGLGVVGLVMLLSGLSVDAILHARNPDLAHRESLFTLSNPGHLMLFVGLVAVAVGVVGATWTLFGLTSDPRRSRPVRALLLVVMAWYATLSMVALDRAAVAESATNGAAAGAAGHVHAAAGSCLPTPEQLGAAARLIADTRLGLARYAHLRDALAAGYAPHGGAREAVKHYFNPAYVTDGRVLDPTRPEGLVYANTDRGPVLVAAIYLMNRAGEPGRAVGGCLTAWHVHDNLCSTNPAKGLITGLRPQGGACPRGQLPWAAPPMLHTWLIDVPGGPFAAHGGVGAVFGQLRASPRPSSGRPASAVRLSARHHGTSAMTKTVTVAL